MADEEEAEEEKLDQVSEGERSRVEMVIHLSNNGPSKEVNEQ